MQSYAGEAICFEADTFEIQNQQAALKAAKREWHRICEENTMEDCCFNCGFPVYSYKNAAYPTTYLEVMLDQ